MSKYYSSFDGTWILSERRPERELNKFLLTLSVVQTLKEGWH